MYGFKYIFKGLGIIRKICLPAVVQPPLERIDRWRCLDGGWKSVPRPEHSKGECYLPSGELESRLPDLELIPTKVAYSLRKGSEDSGRQFSKAPAHHEENSTSAGEPFSALQRGLEGSVDGHSKVHNMSS